MTIEKNFPCAAEFYLDTPCWNERTNAFYDPAMLAFAYTTPISALIHLCDREPKKTDEAMRQVEAFSRHFIKEYGA